MVAPSLRAERLIMTKKEIIREFIKKDAIRRKSRYQMNEHWLLMMDQEERHILYYASGRFPDMKIEELVSIVREIQEETNHYYTILKEVYENE